VLELPWETCWEPSLAKRSAQWWALQDTRGNGHARSQLDGSVPTASSHSLVLGSLEGAIVGAVGPIVGTLVGRRVGWVVGRTVGEAVGDTVTVAPLPGWLMTRSAAIQRMASPCQEP
jgi:hypothetical protein